MPVACGLDFSLMCDNVRLEEYDPHFTEATFTKSVTVFTQSESGKKFAFQFKSSDGLVPDSDLNIIIKLDGIIVVNRLHRSGRLLDNLVHGALVDDGNSVKPFVFQPMQLIDGQGSCNDENVVKNLGTISVEVSRCRLGHSEPWKDHALPRLASEEQFPESNKKAAIPHAAGFGETFVPSNHRKLVCITLIRKDPSPFVCFIWKYRSKAVLQAQGHIPLSQTPILTDKKSELRLIAKSERDEKTTDCKSIVKDDNDDCEIVELNPRKKVKRFDLTGDDDILVAGPSDSKKLKLQSDDYQTLSYKFVNGVIDLT